MKKLFRDTLVNHGQTEESLHKHHLFYSSNTIALEGLHDKDIIVDFFISKTFHEIPRGCVQNPNELTVYFQQLLM